MDAPACRILESSAISATAGMRGTGAIPRRHEAVNGISNRFQNRKPRAASRNRGASMRVPLSPNGPAISCARCGFDPDQGISPRLCESVVEESRKESSMSFVQAQWPFIGALVSWLKPSSHERDLEFLEKASGEEMQRLRAHVRAQPEDLRWLVGREPASSELLCHMLAATHIDANELPAETMRDLEQSCSRCQDKMHCADEIGTRHAAQTFEQFCPNAEKLKKLRAEGER
jgi:hypothetical protein